MRKGFSFLNLSVFFILSVFISFDTLKAAAPNITIISSSESTPAERLAAKEIRRYLYLRSGNLLPILQVNNRPPLKNSAIIVGQKDSTVIQSMTARNTALASIIGTLQPQQYILNTIPLRRGQAVLVVGGDSIGTLYAAYRFAEHLGVRFYLHGDTIPDKQISIKIPKLIEKGNPLFNLRGIQPFHDFPEGPDWWNIDDYKAVLGQLPKMRMNFFGLHTYPHGGVGPEPTVWIGMPGDFNKDGSVNFSYPSRHFTTANITGAWGYKPTKTSDYTFGAAQIFERDDYGPDYMQGMNPWTKLPPQKANELFNRMGKVLKETFEYANSLGIKTCIGTETPLIIPDPVKERLKSKGMNPSDPAVVQKLYEGMFQRIINTHPLDYYWFWTPEGWTWGNPKDEQVEATIADFRAAIAAVEKVNAPFTLATCGWVLGPPKDRALFDNILPKKMPVSCINRSVGFSPVETGFARIEGRPQWAIPWLEDDPAMIIPQLWVGRMRRDAADAHAYGCTGLLGIHWRTRILGPNVSALAHAAWQQKKWNPNFGRRIKHPDPNMAEGHDDRPRDLPARDFYADWALTQFGPEAFVKIADIFTKLDGGPHIKNKRIANMPRPSDWVKGPGGIKPDKRPWSQVEKEYAFVREMAQLRPLIKGAGNLQRFYYWLNNFRYLRAVGHVNCTWAKFNDAMKIIKDQKNPDEKKRLARILALSLRKELIAQVAEVHQFLLSTVNTNGAFGNVTNWQQHIIPTLLTEPGKELADILGEDLPADAMPSNKHPGRLRIIVPTLRTNLNNNEDLKLKVIILSQKPAEDAALYWRTMGKGTYNKIALKHIAHGVYSVTIPALKIKNDLEYYIKVSSTDNQQLTFPVTAPNINQTIVVNDAPMTN